MAFEEWRLKQDLNEWSYKYRNKVNSSKIDNLKVKLTFEEYIYKAYEANLTSPSEVSNTGYHLSRIGDIGNYEVHNCRFITSTKNRLEKDTTYLLGNQYSLNNTHNQGEKNFGSKLNKMQVIQIWFDKRTTAEISLFYNISKNSIRSIKNSSTWTSVTNELPTLNRNETL